MTRRVVLLGVFVLAVSFGIVATMCPGDARAADGSQPPLTMEELEVRGKHEKPDKLFLPTPGGIRHSTSVRFDLFREDMTKPVHPWEIDTRNRSEGGNRDYEYASD